MMIIIQKHQEVYGNTIEVNQLQIIMALLLTYTKLYVPVVTLSTQFNEKLWQQLKSSLERTINSNKYQSKVTIQERNWYLEYLADPSFKRSQ